MTTLNVPDVDADAQHLVLYDVTWHFYEFLLRELERDHRHLRVTYDEGTLEIMSPLLEHEKMKKLIARMIEVISMEMDIPIAGYGSTTYRKKRKRKGLEPDECYYVQSEPKVRGRLSFEPSRFPPDLAVEVDVTSSVIDRTETYAGLAVVGVWRHEGGTLQALKLVQGEYEPVENSVAFPFLRVRELERFLKMFPARGEHATIQAFQKWVREKLVRRR
jgi:Uma2 family endonuclease